MKDSGLPYIGVIPAQWNLFRLKAFFAPSAITNKPDARVLSLYRDYGVIPKDSRDDNHNVTSLDTSKYKYVNRGDFVINKMKAWQGSMALSGYDGIVSPAYHVFKFRSEGLWPRYAHYLLRCSSLSDLWRGLSTGLRVGQWDLHVDDFLNTYIPLPPLNEQRRIADYLDAKCTEIDGAIKSAESSISDYKAYRNALVYQTVMHGMSSHSQSVKESGVSYIGTIPQNWSCVPIKLRFEIVKRIAGGGGFKVLSITQKGLKPKDFSTGKGQFARSYDNYQIVEPGDFAMNHMDLVTGWVDLSSQLGVTSPDYRVFKARDESMEKRYYLYVFQSYYSALVFYGFGKGISGKGRWRLPAPAFYSTMIPVPPLNEQHVIADYLDAKCSIIDEAITSKQSIIDDLKAYKQSLIYEVVTGKKEV